MEATFGARVRAMRIEARKTQDELAGALTERGFACSRRWVTGIEGGEFEPSIAGLLALQAVLGADVRYLLMGAQPEDSEFLARLRGMEPLMDDRGRREVLRVASHQVEEAATGAEVTRLLREVRPDLAGLLDELAAMPALTPPGPAEVPDTAEATRPQRQRGRGQA